MSEELEPKHLFQFGLIMLGIIFLFLSKTIPTSPITTLIKYLLIVLGFLYLFYKFVSGENIAKKIFLAASMILVGFILLVLSFQNNIGECNATKPCNESQLCGTDHLCHDIPQYNVIVTKLTVERNISFTFGGIIIGLGIIISAILLRGTSFSALLRRIFRF